MTGGDWLWITIIVGFLILVWVIDAIGRLEDRQAERADRAAADQRLKREIRRQP